MTQKNEYLYFTNDGSGRTFLGPAPVNGINYQKEWVENNPKTDNGELMYGLLTMIHGNYNASTGAITPGYGLPLSPSPFESSMSLTYRTWQWARSFPLLLFVLPAIFVFLSLLTIGNNKVSSYFTYAAAHMIVFGILLLPLLFVWAIWFVLSSAKTSRRNAERAIEDKYFNDTEVERFVSQYYCPLCNQHALNYNTVTNEASCPAKHGPFRIAF